MQKVTNQNATLGFTLSLIAIFIGWIPVFGWIAWILGLGFSCRGFYKVNSLDGAGRGFSIAGLLISLVGLIMIIVFSSFVFSLINILPAENNSLNIKFFNFL